MKHLILLITIVIGGCNVTPYYSPNHNPTPSVSQASTKRMLFGGHNNNTYLGCINCNKYSTDSVLNAYGNYGSPYSPTSIFNTYSEYGSSYSNYSPCNRYASNPPVIVDSNGNFYGYLTINQFLPYATRNQSILAWLTGVCAGR